MAKRVSLADSMKSVQQAPATPRAAAEAVAAATPLRSAPPPVAKASRFAATREGMKRITLMSAPEKHRRLKRLSADVDRSLEDLMREALDDLLAKHGA